MPCRTIPTVDRNGNPVRPAAATGRSSNVQRVWPRSEHGRSRYFRMGPDGCLTDAVAERFQHGWRRPEYGGHPMAPPRSRCRTSRTAMDRTPNRNQYNVRIDHNFNSSHKASSAEPGRRLGRDRTGGHFALAGRLQRLGAPQARCLYGVVGLHAVANHRERIPCRRATKLEL